MVDVVLLRHGESEGVKNHILQGHIDLPLTDNGREQIQTLAAYWHNSKQSFRRIVTSPLKRARETGEIIASQLNIPEILEEPLWIERDFGKGEGVGLDRISDWYKSRPEPAVYEPIYETGESEWQVHLRAGNAIEKLMMSLEGDTLVVSHGNVINAALHMIFGMYPIGRSRLVVFALEPGGYAKLKFNQNASVWSLLGFNNPLMK